MSPTFSPVAIDFLHKVPRGPDPKAYLLLSRTFLLSTYVPPSATFGTEFVGDCNRTLAQLDPAQRRWGRHLLGWASGTPCASVLYELALPDSLRLSTGRALALFGRLHSLTAGARVPLPAAVFDLSQNTRGTWAHWCLSLLQHHAAGNPADFWCRAALLLSGHPSMVTSRCQSLVGSSVVSSSPSRPRPPLWYPLQPWSCPSLRAGPYGLPFHC